MVSKKGEHQIGLIWKRLLVSKHWYIQRSNFDILWFCISAIKLTIFNLLTKISIHYNIKYIGTSERRSLRDLDVWKRCICDYMFSPPPSVSRWSVGLAAYCSVFRPEKLFEKSWCFENITLIPHSGIIANRALYIDTQIFTSCGRWDVDVFMIIIIMKTSIAKLLWRYQNLILALLVIMSIVPQYFSESWNTLIFLPPSMTPFICSRASVAASGTSYSTNANPLCLLAIASHDKLTFFIGPNGRKACLTVSSRTSKLILPT